MPQKTKLIIFAGPPSSGKSIIFQLIGKKYSVVQLLPEINPYTVIGNHHHGGAFVDHSQEIKITEANIQRLIAILHQQKVFVTESDIFHLAYHKKLRNNKTFATYQKLYYQLYQKLHVSIFFIDTKPHISFRRRKTIYLNRVKDKDPKTRRAMINAYESNIYELYPHLIELYNELPFDKIMIKNSYKSRGRFIKESITKLEAVLAYRHYTSASG